MGSRFLRRTQVLRTALLGALGIVACGGRTELLGLDDGSSSGATGPLVTGGRSSTGGAPNSGGAGASPNGGTDSGGASSGGAPSGGTSGNGGAASGGSGDQETCIFGADKEFLSSGSIDVGRALARTETELLIAGYYGSGAGEAQTHHSALVRLRPDDSLLDDYVVSFTEYDEPRGIAAHPSGSVFLAGIAFEPTDDSAQSIVARWNAAGALWATFEGSGRNEHTTAIAAGPAGTTYVVGFSYGPLGPNDTPQAFLRRYLDVESGTRTVEFDVSDLTRLNAVYVTASGDVHIAGSSLIQGRHRAHLSVLKGDSRIHRNFDEDAEEATAVLVADDGTIHLAGSGTHGAFAKRITNNGRELFTSWMNVSNVKSVTRGLAFDARGAVWWTGGYAEEGGGRSFLTALAEDGDRPWTITFDGIAYAIAGDDSCNLYLAGDFPDGEGESALIKVPGRPQ